MFDKKIELSPDIEFIKRVTTNSNERCWNTGEYTDNCCCEMCPHRDECSGYDKEKEDD